MILVYVIKEPPPPPRKTRAELMKDIDADYYGYRDEDDGILVPIEREMEKKVRQLFFDLYFCPMAEYFLVCFSHHYLNSLGVPFLYFCEC